MSTKEAVEARYAEICDALGIASRPALKLVPRLEQFSRRLAGVYVAGNHTLTLPVSDGPNDFVIVHELCHSVAARTVGYRGIHGAPYLALLHLACLYYFPSYNGSIIELTVREEWPFLVPRRWREREIEAATQIASLVQAECEGAERPSIEALAERVKHYFPERVNGHMSMLGRWRDRAMTQKGVWMGYWCVFATALTFILTYCAHWLPSASSRGELLVWVSRFWMGSVLCVLVISAIQNLLNKVGDAKRRLKEIFKRS
ncbi:hypothetical protein NLY09_14345 (plasmid) [Burkholderia vietnamiensis]